MRNFLTRGSASAHTWAPLYAVDALEPDERARFEDHVVGCRSCQEELRRFGATTAALARAAATEPPPQLRANVLQAIHRTEQAPQTAAVRVAETPVAATSPQNTAQRAARARNTGSARHGEDTGTTVERMRRRYRRWLAATAGAALVPGALLGGWGATVQAQNAHDEIQQREQQLLAQQRIAVRVVSMPSTSAFDRQSVQYKQSVLPDGVPRIAVEMGVTDGWWKYGAAAVVGIDCFGESAPAGVLFKHFGFTAENVAATVRAALQRKH